MSLPGAKKLLMANKRRWTQQNYDALPAMTDFNKPDGHLASASLNDPNGAVAWRLFNKTDEPAVGAVMESTSGWFQRQTPAAIRVWKFGLLSRDGVANQTPKDFELQGSNDGVNFTTLVSIAAQTNWAAHTVRYFEIPEGVRNAYIYHRLNITANNGSTYIALNEIYLFQEVRP